MARLIGKFRAEGGDMEWIYKGTYPQKLAPILKLARKITNYIIIVRSDQCKVLAKFIGSTTSKSRSYSSCINNLSEVCVF